MSADLTQLRAYVEYMRDLGVYDFYRQRRADPESEIARAVAEFAGRATQTPEPAHVPAASPAASSAVAGRTPQTRAQPVPAVSAEAVPVRKTPMSAEQQALEVPIGKLISLDELFPRADARVAPDAKETALAAVREQIGDCTRCPLAYAGRHTIVFGNGDPNARLMFVGEGPGADEDASGLPFVGKAGQLLNNMITAMGLKREQVYVANVVKCRPPGNRAPEPAEANTCTQFLAEQIAIVQPQVVVALGLTAASYLLGVRQSLGSLRGRWHAVRGAKLAVTYHPAFLLRDPRQKGEAWKDLQMVMAELKLKAPAVKS